jgi:hypothetical protein
LEGAPEKIRDLRRPLGSLFKGCSIGSALTICTAYWPSQPASYQQVHEHDQDLEGREYGERHGAAPPLSSRLPATIKDPLLPARNKLLTPECQG